MPITLERHDPQWTIRLEGGITLTSAAELKKALLEWLATGKNLELDLEQAEEIDIAVMQVLGAAAREAARTGAAISGRASRAATAAVHDAGFDQMPGFPVRE